jgi:flagellar hook-basal body complex protein FliE
MKINQFVPDSKIFESFNIQDNKTEKTGKNFLDTLKEKLDDVNDKQINAENTTDQFIKGEETDIHKVMLDTEEAKMSLELAVQIRNKLVEAYQELSRMQL